jgi:hypothetical protein
VPLVPLLRKPEEPVPLPVPLFRKPDVPVPVPPLLLRKPLDPVPDKLPLLLPAPPVFAPVLFKFAWA